MDMLTPKEIVAVLDRHIVGQSDAKRAVALALRGQGYGKARAFLIALLTGLVEPVGGLLGVALVGAAFRPSWRIAATATAAGFSLLHALVHVVDTVRGLVGPEHWMIDAPGVYAPAVVLTALALWIRRSYA